MIRILALVVLAACNPYLTAESVAPPGRAARLDPVDGFWTVKSYRLELSSGVAVALTCTQSGPCEHVKATSDDPAIAEIRPASLGVLARASFTDQQPASAVVVVGKAPGTTRLHLRTDDGHRDIAVTILPPAAGDVTV